MNKKTSKKFSDCLTSDLPAAASVFPITVLQHQHTQQQQHKNGGMYGPLVSSTHGIPPLIPLPPPRRRNNNNANGSSRNFGKRKSQIFVSGNNNNGMLPPPLSPSPPISQESSTEIRPQRKPRKNKKSNNSRKCGGTNATSTCSLASIATTSSGLSSGASSMATLHDQDNGPSPDTLIKSSSSSAASSAGFGDMTSNDDEDFHGYDDASFSIDPAVFSRQWSMPMEPSEPFPAPMSKPKSKNRNNRKNNPNSNYPNLENPAVKQYFIEQHAFYRKIYDQIFAVQSAIKSATSPDAPKPPKPERQLSEPSKPQPGYIPHQHLGLPPLPPPTTPWIYQQSYHLQPPETILPSPCEEAFLKHLKSHAIPKQRPKTSSVSSSSKKAIEIPSIIPVSNIPSSSVINSSIVPKVTPKPKVQSSLSSQKASVEALAARADFHKQIRDRLLAAASQNDSKSSGKSINMCSLSDAAAVAGVATPPYPLSQGALTEDQSLFLQSLPLRCTFSQSVSASPTAAVVPPKEPTTTTDSPRGRRNNKARNKSNPEFCMMDNDFPPISRLSTSFSKDSHKGESGYQSEFSGQCSTADGETDSRCSDPVHRNYSSVVANGSQSAGDVHDLKEDEDELSISSDEPVTSPAPEDISRMDLLSEHICEYYEGVAQTEKTLLKKLRLRDMLYYSLAPIFPVCGLYVVGSSLNGFGNEYSDMDLCLVITPNELDQRSEAVQVLQLVEKALSVLPVITEQKLILAKVPILRMKFSGPYSNITVDLNANNAVAIKNTHLLCYYAFFDWRLRPMVAVVKEWAKRCNINDASRSSFTSYSLVLMVIHYLQAGVEKPVLPSLQKLYPRRFNSQNDIRMLNVSLPLDDVPSHCTFERNDDVTLGELLIGFFRYYAEVYNYEDNAISIRLGTQVERKAILKNSRLQWSPIVIEEPFTHLNTAHSVYDERVFKAIKKKFHEAYETLTRTSDVSELLNVRPHSVSPDYVPNLSA